MLKIGWAKITAAGDSVAKFFTQQITYRNKVSNVLVVYPYGYHANAKVDESLVLMFGVNGDSENKAGIPFQPNIRPDLKEGEVAIYQPGTNTVIKFLQNENIVINTDKDIEAACDNMTVTAATKVTVTAPNTEFVSDVKVTGNFEVTGSSTLSSTVTSGGKDISDSHGHAQANDSGGDTQVNISGVT